MAKSFHWTPDEKFEITGAELEVIHNTLHTFFHTNVPDPQKHVYLNEAFKAAGSIVTRGIQEGKIKEENTETKNS